MDKIFSARLDELIIHRIGELAHQLKTSKKRVVEEAIECYAEKAGEKSGSDVFAKTFGAWKRHETANETIRNMRTSFQRSMQRHRM